MILCMNCKHYVGAQFAEIDKCAHPDAVNSLSVVRGDDVGMPCIAMRIGKCGMEAKLYEERPNGKS